MASKMQVTFPLNNVDYQAEDMQLWHSSRTNGVFSDNGEFLTTATSGRVIQVSPGRAWISYEKFRGIIFGNFENINLTIDIADGIFDRIDRVVIRYDIINNITELKIKKGVPSANPVAADLERNNINAYELGIATVKMPKGALEVRQSYITDTRIDPTVCGVMRDGVTGIPTEGLLQQFQDWFKDVENVLDANTAGNLLNLINENKNNITNLTSKVNNGQNFKLTNDDGRYLEDNSNLNIDNFYFGWKNIYNAKGTLPTGISQDDNNLIIECKGTDINFIKQVCYDVRSEKTWNRSRINGSWKNWRSL